MGIFRSLLMRQQRQPLSQARGSTLAYLCTSAQHAQPPLLSRLHRVIAWGQCQVLSSGDSRVNIRGTASPRACCGSQRGVRKRARVGVCTGTPSWRQGHLLGLDSALFPLTRQRALVVRQVEDLMESSLLGAVDTACVLVPAQAGRRAGHVAAGRGGLHLGGQESGVSCPSCALHSKPCLMRPSW